MSKEMLTTMTQKGGENKGEATFARYSEDQEGLANAIEDYGLDRVVALLNSSVRIHEQGRVRDGGDPVKGAQASVARLNSDQKAALLQELQADLA